jgi:NTE family protein
LLLALATGCASLEAVNQPLAKVDTSHGYRPSDASHYRDVGDVLLFVAFSGGGTRAASFAYGVMEELRDTEIGSGAESRRLLDEVDGISGVSGGSFPAAYYGLFGDRIFDEFEERFLRKNVQGALMWRMLAPWNLVRLPGPNVSRTRIALDFYDEHVFEHKTFGDLAKLEGRPRVYVNTTDLVQGNRFSFDQNTFDIICSDLDPFPISAATAASSAVPGLLSPLVLKNFAGQCGFETPEWVKELLADRANRPRGAHAAGQFASYLDPEKKRYIHLVDGGVADNLGMTVVLERLAVLGSIERYSEKFGFGTPDHIIVIVVNAATEPSDKLNMKAVSPDLAGTMSLISGVQRANFETLDLTQRTVRAIHEKLNKPDHPVTAHFVEVSFDLSDSEEERDYLKHLPTSFKLSDEQVDRLIAAGRKILRESAHFKAALETIR